MNKEIHTNGWVRIPQEIFEALGNVGLKVVKKETRFTLYDKKFYFPYAIETILGDFYLCYVPNSWGRKTRSAFLRESLSVIEELADENDLNLIVILEQELVENGAELVVKSIFNKIYPHEYKNVNLRIDKKNKKVEFYNNNEYAGFAVFDDGPTMLNVKEWFSYVDPAFWVDRLAIEMGSASYKIKVHRDSPLPYRKISSFSSGMRSTEFNYPLKNGLHIYRTSGIFFVRKATMLREYDETGVMLPERQTKRANYQSPRGTLVKDNLFLLNKLSDNNDTSIYERSDNSLTFALFQCKEEEEHEYYAMLKEQKRFGCPVCEGITVLEGVNDLATTDPHIAALWDYEANFPVRPTDVSRKSDKIFSWICSVSGGKWISTVGLLVVTNGGSPFVQNKTILKGFNDLATVYPFLVDLFSQSNGVDLGTLVSSDTRNFLWECKECGSSWKRKVATIIKNNGCRECNGYGKGSSKGEKELYDYITSIYSGVVHRGSRKVIYPSELDIFIPDLNIAIEYNGLYWHSEDMLKKRGVDPKSYHFNKWKKCSEKSVQLITIWEDEWRDKQDVVKSMLAHKLGVSSSQKVFARNTVVVEVDAKSARVFCEEYHIQGFANGSVYYALVDKNDLSKLYAVSIWRKNKDVLYLDRYCTSENVVGGLGKLLKVGKEWAKNNECSQIITFADYQVSNGNLYDTLGFTLEKVIQPDYRYIYEGERKHKFGFRLKRFKNDPLLVYREGLTEAELAELNDIPRLYDCGKARYVLSV